MDNVLFIQLSRMGDCLQSTPLLASWHSRFPDDRITVLVRPENAVIFERNPDVAETIIYDPPVSALVNEAIDPIQRLAELHEWLGTLKSHGFRSVINLTHNDLSCWITTAMGSKEIRGLYAGSSGRMRTRNPWCLYVFSLLTFRKTNLFNIVDAYAHFSGNASPISTPMFPLDPESIRFADEWATPCKPDGAIVGFQPGASLAERRWPAEHFIAVGRHLAAEGIRVLVFGSKAEEKLGDAIARDIPEAINLAGKTTIPQLAALLARCTVLVTNDTGTMHLGTAVGTRILALFESSAYFRETGPYGAGHWVIQSPHLIEYGKETADTSESIGRISPDEVLWATGQLLGEIKGNKENSRLQAAPQLKAQHFRSLRESEHLIFYPAHPLPLDAETICSQLQKPVWLATLDGGELSAKETAASVFAFLRRYYIAPPDGDLRRTIEGAQEEVNKSLIAVKQMRQILQTTLGKLRRNPKHIVPQDILAELTRLEEFIVQKESFPSINGFTGYFETGLAMVDGNTTLEYLENYLIPVSLLERQLILFNQLLAVCC